MRTVSFGGAATLIVMAMVVAVCVPARATDVAAPIRAGDPVYRELQLADLLGLLAEPTRGFPRTDNDPPPPALQ